MANITAQTPEMNDAFIKSLSTLDRVTYKSGYNFHMQCDKNATLESAHEAGKAEVSRVNGIKNKCRNQTLVDVSTGRKFRGNI